MSSFVNCLAPCTDSKFCYCWSHFVHQDQCFSLTYVFVLYFYKNSPVLLAPLPNLLPIHSNVLKKVTAARWQPVSLCSNSGVISHPRKWPGRSPAAGRDRWSRLPSVWWWSLSAGGSTSWRYVITPVNYCHPPSRLWCRRCRRRCSSVVINRRVRLGIPPLPPPTSSRTLARRCTVRHQAFPPEGNRDRSDTNERTGCKPHWDPMSTALSCGSSADNSAYTIEC